MGLTFFKWFETIEAYKAFGFVICVVSHQVSRLIFPHVWSGAITEEAYINPTLTTYLVSQGLSDLLDRENLILFRRYQIMF